MVDLELLHKAEKMLEIYESNWGKQPETVCMPPGMTQKDFVEVLERIVETGESILVGWGKVLQGRSESGT